MPFVPIALVVGLLASSPATAAVAGGQQSFAAIAERVHTGTRLQIEDRTGVRTLGALASATADEITLDTRDGPRRFQRAAVTTVAVRGTYAKRFALIGAAVGAALCIPCTRGEHGDADAPVLTGLLGAGAGALVGAAVPRLKTVYRAGDRPIALSLAPEASARRVGLVLHARW